MSKVAIAPAEDFVRVSGADDPLRTESFALARVWSMSANQNDGSMAIAHYEQFVLFVTQEREIFNFSS